MSKTGEAGKQMALDGGCGASKIAAIEADLARIARAIGELRTAGVVSTSYIAGIASTLADLQREAAQLTPAPNAEPFRMAPLSLLSLASEQLTLIRGIDAGAAAILNEAGIHHFADIAALTADDVAELGRMLGDTRRIASQGWIEQAALLADGIETAHAMRIRAGDFACIVALSGSAPAVVTPAAAIKPVARGAEIVDLAQRRAKQRAAAAHRAPMAARIAAAAAVAVAIATMALDGSNLVQQLITGLGFKGACSTSLTALFSQCTVAWLP